MPPRLFPQNPIFKDSSERLVWEALVSTLPEDAVLISGLEIRSYEQDHEIDFMVVIPEVGIAILEVKGGRVTPNEDSTFTQKGRLEEHSIDPITQINKSQYQLKRYIESKSSIQHFSSRSHLVFPYSDIPSAYTRPNIPRQIIHDEVDLPSLTARIENDLLQSHFRPSAIEIHSILKCLGQAINTQKSLMELGVERANRISELTSQQFQILDYCKAMPRFSVLGAAGCGKTYVAMEQARRRSIAGDRVLFLCYNKGLSEFLKKKFEDSPESQRPTIVATLHSLSYKLGIPIPHRDGDHFWDIELPELLAQELQNLEIGSKFETVIIDEAQDFHPEWWKVVTSALKDKDQGRIYAFGDLRQGIFRHASDIPLTPAAMHLDVNLRNSLPIAELASLCIEDDLLLAGLDGPPVRFVDVLQDQAVVTGNQIIKDLIEEGWQPGEIALLTTGSRHPIQKETAEGASKIDYWNTFLKGEEVFYGHILGFKGLERRAVVLVINGWKNEDAKKDFIYTGLTRARDLLVICGSSDDIRQAGGKEFLKRLTRAN